MPKLLAFLPCEQAIISKDDETVSLITVMQGLSLGVPDEVIGQNVLLPHRWSVFSYWLKEAGEDGVTFEQRLEYISPQNAALLKQDSQFVIVKTTHSQVGRIGALPLLSAKPGQYVYSLRLSLRRVGEPDFKVVSEFPLSITIEAASNGVVSQK